jgi:hypothetical protein
VASCFSLKSHHLKKNPGIRLSTLFRLKLNNMGKSGKNTKKQTGPSPPFKIYGPSAANPAEQPPADLYNNILDEKRQFSVKVTSEYRLSGIVSMRHSGWNTTS